MAMNFALRLLASPYSQARALPVLVRRWHLLFVVVSRLADLEHARVALQPRTRGLTYLMVPRSRSRWRRLWIGADESTKERLNQIRLWSVILLGSKRLQQVGFWPRLGSKRRGVRKLTQCLAAQHAHA